MFKEAKDSNFVLLHVNDDAKPSQEGNQVKWNTEQLQREQEFKLDSKKLMVETLDEREVHHDQDSKEGSLYKVSQDHWYPSQQVSKEYTEKENKIWDGGKDTGL